MVYRLPDNSWVQIGITNFGTDRKECELAVARGFTRVKSYLKWITSVTGIPHPFSCNWKADGSYANPDDCTTFYMCSNQNEYLFVSIICPKLLLIMLLMCCYLLLIIYIRIARPHWSSIRILNSVIIISTCRIVKQVDLPNLKDIADQSNQLRIT